MPAVQISACCELPYAAPGGPTQACGLHVYLYLTAAKNGLLSWFINGKWCEAMHFLAVVLCLAFSVAWDQVSPVTAGSGMFHECTGTSKGRCLLGAQTRLPPIHLLVPPAAANGAVLAQHPFSGFGVMARYFLTICFSRILRVVCFMSTVLPSPRPGCYRCAPCQGTVTCKSCLLVDGHNWRNMPELATAAVTVTNLPGIVREAVRARRPADSQ